MFESCTHNERLRCFAAIRSLFFGGKTMDEYLRFFDGYEFISDNERYKLYSIKYYTELPWSVAEEWLKDAFKYIEDSEKLVFITQFPEIESYLK